MSLEDEGGPAFLVQPSAGLHDVAVVGWDVMEMELLGVPGDSLSGDEDGRASSPVRATASILEVLEVQVCLPLHTPINRGLPMLRRSRTPVSVLSLHRSKRLAAKLRDPNSTKQAQCVLMQKLGVVASSPNVGSETVRKYKATFQAPLSTSKQETLQMLFSGDFDPVANDSGHGRGRRGGGLVPRALFIPHREFVYNVVVASSCFAWNVHGLTT